LPLNRKFWVIICHLEISLIVEQCCVTFKPHVNNREAARAPAAPMKRLFDSSHQSTDAFLRGRDGVSARRRETQASTRARITTPLNSGADLLDVQTTLGDRCVAAKIVADHRGSVSSLSAGAGARAINRRVSEGAETMYLNSGNVRSNQHIASG
jgi:hypothetical protein